MCYCPTPTLHLNLALTGDGAFQLSLKKTHSVWFISVLNYGDTENVLINHLLLVIPMSYPCHYTNLCPHKPHKHAPTHTRTHTRTHTHTHTHTQERLIAPRLCFIQWRAAQVTWHWENLMRNIWVCIEITDLIRRCETWGETCFCSQRLHLFDQKYSKNSNIVNYFLQFQIAVFYFKTCHLPPGEESSTKTFLEAGWTLLSAANTFLWECHRKHPMLLCNCVVFQPHSTGQEGLGPCG